MSVLQKNVIRGEIRTLNEDLINAKIGFHCTIEHFSKLIGRKYYFIIIFEPKGTKKRFSAIIF